MLVYFIYVLSHLTGREKTPEILKRLNFFLVARYFMLVACKFLLVACYLLLVARYFLLGARYFFVQITVK